MSRPTAASAPADALEKDYYAQAAAWDRDRVAGLERSERRAWRVTYAALGVAVLGWAMVPVLLPLKRDVPIPILVDRATGAVEVVRPLANEPMSHAEANTTAAIKRYVRCREEYARQLLMSQYQTCMAMTAEPRRRELNAAFAEQNPQGPYARYREEGWAKVEFRSVTYIAEGLALVRFAKIERLPGVEKPETKQWVARVAFELSGLPAGDFAREVNPLGFQATEYRADREDETK